MKRLSRLLALSGLTGLRRATGFTLVSNLVSVFVGATVLLGGWAAYRDFSMQWRVSNAERQMDQYAHSAMTEMVNILQWSCGAHTPNVSGVSNRMTIAIGDFVGENGGLSSTNMKTGHFPYSTDNYFTASRFIKGHSMDGGFINLTYHQDRGILINGLEPAWAKSDNFVWRGRPLRSGRDALAAFDSRDRMRVTDFSVDFPLISDPYAGYEGDGGTTLRSSVIRIKMVMQYRYRMDDSFGLYGEDYVRERVYETSVNFLNHALAINGNQYFQEFTATGATGF